MTAAASCTSGTTDGGTIVLQNSRGTVRNCVIPNQITGSLTLSGRRADGIMYSLNGRTDIGTDTSQAGTAATLTVLPGVTVFGASQDSSLIVQRGSKLVADATSSQPIIFTALTNLTTTLTQAADNLWGGIIINGKAPVSDCQTPGTGTVGGAADCWRNDEGVTTTTSGGGNVSNDNSGVLRYVQVNFTGVGANASEIQGITTVGVGSGTTLEYLQIHNSKDDGIESFGGTQNMRRLVFTGIADDSLDTDNGYTGAVQFVLAVRRGATGTLGDSVGAQTILEVDSSASNNAAPRQYLKLANFTFVQTRDEEPVIRLRGGADVDLVNGIVVAETTDSATGENGCFDVDDAETVQAAGDYGSPLTADRGPPRLLSVVFDCSLVIDDDADTYENAALTNAENSNVNTSFTQTLLFLTGASTGYKFADGTNEIAVTAYASLTTISSYFTQVSYIGAFSGASDTWTSDWTCNSDVADLRGATDCTDIRIS